MYIKKVMFILILMVFTESTLAQVSLSEINNYNLCFNIAKHDLDSITPLTVSLSNSFAYIISEERTNTITTTHDEDSISELVEIKPKESNFTQPIGVALDKTGNVYIADTGNNCIQKFDSKGISLAKWGTEGSEDGQFNYPYGITLDASGNVYATDYLNCRVQKFTSDGVFLTKWEVKSPDDSYSGKPQSIASDSLGNIYLTDWSNHQVYKFTSNGTYLTRWGTYGSDNGQFDYPDGIAVDKSGNVYVADTMNHRIQKFDANGSFIAKWGREGSDDGQFDKPVGVAIDDSGNIFVVDQNNQRIQKFDSNGAFLAKWSINGSGDNQFRHPTGIAVDASYNLYIADTGNNRVLKLTLNSVLSVNAFADGQSTKAIVFMDNNEAGYTPYKTVITEGKHKVRVGMNLYHDYSEIVTIAKSREYIVNATLQPAFGSLEVNTIPAGAIVELFNVNRKIQNKGNTPFLLDKIPSGVYKLRLVKDSYYIENRSITVQDSQKSIVSFQLKHKTSRVKLALLSSGFPGLGQYWGRRYISGSAFLLGGLCAVTGAVTSYFQYERSVDKYNDAVDRYHNSNSANIDISRQEMIKAHDNADNKFLFRQIAFATAGGIWALNVLHILIAGPKSESSPQTPQADLSGWIISPQIARHTVGVLVCFGFR